MDDTATVAETAETAETAEQNEHLESEPVEEELLVEEVSIDGMCGVY
jgi:mycofactocin precursor